MHGLLHQIDLEHWTSTGHRIVDHPGKCARLHGHEYRWQVACASDRLQGQGFVADFAYVKAVLDEWDHRLLLWERDPIKLDGNMTQEMELGVVRTSFNPTAENMAKDAAIRISQILLSPCAVEVVVWETVKCSARFHARRNG